MPLLTYPLNRQTYSFDCGADMLMSALLFCGIEEREDRVLAQARTGKAGTSIAGVLSVLRYYGLPFRAGRMTCDDLRRAVDAGHATLLTLQAYRTSSRPYRELWGDGHWVGCIGYQTPGRFYFEDPSAFHRTWLAERELIERWHDVDRGRRIRRWGCTLLVQGRYRPGAIAHMD
ncbi:MAG: hypothetical protein ABSG68_26385 [Thermoguttaceae bacterium]|jgi:ABC-type bacteriocin/lantibiotic exporter with double-glycine peptidase domain